MAIICIALLLGNEYPSFKGYRILTIYHTEPPDLFNFNYKPGKTGINVRTDQYMEIMFKRKAMMDQIIIDKKTYEKNTQWIREMRKYLLTMKPL